MIAEARNQNLISANSPKFGYNQFKDCWQMWLRHIGSGLYVLCCLALLIGVVLSYGNEESAKQEMAITVLYYTFAAYPIAIACILIAGCPASKAFRFSSLKSKSGRTLHAIAHLLWVFGVLSWISFILLIWTNHPAFPDLGLSISDSILILFGFSGIIALPQIGIWLLIEYGLDFGDWLKKRKAEEEQQT